MRNHVTLYYFSPTGGTKAVADILCSALAASVTAIDLGARTAAVPAVPADTLTVVAAPVFVGRIPAFVMDKLHTLQGCGRDAVALAVYGNRDYDDALLELSDCLTECGFHLLAAGACIAQHSQLPELAAGRPDGTDRAGLRAFAASILEKLASGSYSNLRIPGNRPYRDRLPASTTPRTTDACTQCGLCQRLCPTDAICLADTVVTDASKCILCRACTAHCPVGARIVAPEAEAKLREKLSAFLDIRRENLYIL